MLLILWKARAVGCSKTGLNWTTFTQHERGCEAGVCLPFPVWMIRSLEGRSCLLTSLTAPENLTHAHTHHHHQWKSSSEVLVGLLCPWDPHTSFLAAQQISISLAVSKNSIDSPASSGGDFNYSKCRRNENGTAVTALAAEAVDLDRSLPSFVSYSAEWTFAMAATQTRCGRKQMMQNLAGFSIQ